jgi:hypothetical protein
MAELASRGGFLGTTSIQQGTTGGDAFLDFVDFVNKRQPGHKGVVCNAVAGAMRGEFGDVHATERTLGSRMFVNPLMSLQWNYELSSVAGMMGFREDVSKTNDLWEVAGAIRLHHAAQKQREWTPIPL